MATAMATAMAVAVIRPEHAIGADLQENHFVFFMKNGILGLFW